MALLLWLHVALLAVQFWQCSSTVAVVTHTGNVALVEDFTSTVQFVECISTAYASMFTAAFGVCATATELHVLHRLPDTRIQSTVLDAITCASLRNSTLCAASAFAEYDSDTCELHCITSATTFSLKIESSISRGGCSTQIIVDFDETPYLAQPCIFSVSPIVCTGTPIALENSFACAEQGWLTLLSGPPIPITAIAVAASRVKFVYPAGSSCDQTTSASVYYVTANMPCFAITVTLDTNFDFTGDGSIRLCNNASWHAIQGPNIAFSGSGSVLVCLRVLPQLIRIQTLRVEAFSTGTIVIFNGSAAIVPAGTIISSLPTTLKTRRRWVVPPVATGLTATAFGFWPIVSLRVTYATLAPYTTTMDIQFVWESAGCNGDARMAFPNTGDISTPAYNVCRTAITGDKSVHLTSVAVSSGYIQCPSWYTACGVLQYGVCDCVKPYVPEVEHSWSAWSVSCATHKVTRQCPFTNTTQTASCFCGTQFAVIRNTTAVIVNSSDVFIFDEHSIISCYNRSCVMTDVASPGAVYLPIDTRLQDAFTLTFDVAVDTNSTSAWSTVCGNGTRAVSRTSIFPRYNVTLQDSLVEWRETRYISCSQPQTWANTCMQCFCVAFNDRITEFTLPIILSHIATQNCKTYTVIISDKPFGSNTSYPVFLGDPIVLTTPNGLVDVTLTAPDFCYKLRDNTTSMPAVQILASNITIKGLELCAYFHQSMSLLIRAENVTVREFAVRDAPAYATLVNITNKAYSSVYVEIMQPMASLFVDSEGAETVLATDPSSIVLTPQTGHIITSNCAIFPKVTDKIYQAKESEQSYVTSTVVIVGTVIVAVVALVAYIALRSQTLPPRTREKQA